jgi:hypothetical protein
LADDYARQGYYTYVVDYLNGDAVEKDAMNTGKVCARSRSIKEKHY